MKCCRRLWSEQHLARYVHSVLWISYFFSHCHYLFSSAMMSCLACEFFHKMNKIGMKCCRHFWFKQIAFSFKENIFLILPLSYFSRQGYFYSVWIPSPDEHSVEMLSTFENKYIWTEMFASDCFCHIFTVDDICCFVNPIAGQTQHEMLSIFWISNRKNMKWVNILNSDNIFDCQAKFMNILIVNDFIYLACKFCRLTNATWNIVDIWTSVRVSQYLVHD